VEQGVKAKATTRSQVTHQGVQGEAKPTKERKKTAKAPSKRASEVVPPRQSPLGFVKASVVLYDSDEDKEALRAMSQPAGCISPLEHESEEAFSVAPLVPRRLFHSQS
jgi:hypothetical protein